MSEADEEAIPDSEEAGGSEASDQETAGTRGIGTQSAVPPTIVTADEPSGD